MSSLSIPEQDKKSIVKFFNLNNDLFKKIINALSKLDIGVSDKKIISTIDAVLKKSGEGNKPLQIGQVVLKLFSTIFKYDLGGEKFVNELYQIYLNSDDSDSEKLSKDNFERKFFELYNGISSVTITTKAHILKTDHERILIDTKIFTDVRTVFDTKNPKIINGSVIFHMLKIDYEVDDDMFSNFFAMDKADLLNLKSLIDRALTKEDQIIKNLKNTKLKIIKQ